MAVCWEGCTNRVEKRYELCAIIGYSLRLKKEGGHKTRKYDPFQLPEQIRKGQPFLRNPEKRLAFVPLRDTKL